MARSRKQQHGKPTEGKSASSASANTRQAATSFKHHEHLAMMAKAAKSRRQAKGRGNSKRYCYQGVKGQFPSYQAKAGAAIKVLAG